MTAFNTRSEQLANIAGINARQAWIDTNGLVPSPAGWDIDDYEVFAESEIHDAIDAESFEDDGIGFGDLVIAFRQGFFTC